MKKNTMTDLKNNLCPLGAYAVKGGIRFSFVSRCDVCGIVLYDRLSTKRLAKIPFGTGDRIGNLYSKTVLVEHPETVSYHFYEGKNAVADPYARCFDRKIPFGAAFDARKFKAVLPENDFDWSEDRKPGYDYGNRLVYCLHVRGFTKHASSGVIHKGTFAGLAEKLPYLRETGVTTLELQPVYEFTEAGNYWGYSNGFYYAPKSSYAAADGNAEFKHLVLECHKLGIEVVMQMYFPEDYKRSAIADVLRYWTLEYHVDGFHLKGDNLPIGLLAEDALLADSMLWHNGFDFDAENNSNHFETDGGTLAVYWDDYLYNTRRFLRGDFESLKPAISNMTYMPKVGGRIHYLTNYFGFTLHDMFSYEEKHNEANGENNRDGSDYNCSFNCGAEGATRKKSILSLRMQCMKNALCLLLTGCSTPLIFMGDEFANSQKGNNNPYNQDNQTTYLNWDDLTRNEELYKFWKQMLQLRKEGCFADAAQKDGQERCSLGYPRFSCHGAEAWQMPANASDCSAGIMMCKDKTTNTGDAETDVWYLGINMSCFKQELALPRLPKEYSWCRVLTTAEPAEEKGITGNQPKVVLAERSVAIYRGIKEA